MSDFSQQEFDPSRRRLCPDGSCVGVIGDDGTCRECGAVDPGWTAETGEKSGASPVESRPSVESEPAALKSESGPSGFDPSRRLCSDGACLGLLGPDGRCNVCGLQGETAESLDQV